MIKKLFLIFLILFSFDIFSSEAISVEIINDDYYKVDVQDYYSIKLGFIFKGESEEDLSNFINKLYELRLDKVGYKFIWTKKDIKLNDEFFTIEKFDNKEQTIKLKKSIIYDCYTLFQKRFAQSIINQTNIILDVDINDKKIINIIGNLDILKIVQNKNSFKKIYQDIHKIVYKKELDDKRIVFAVYNKYSGKKLTIEKEELKISDNGWVQNIWTQKNMGIVDFAFEDNFLRGQMKLYIYYF